MITLIIFGTTAQVKEVRRGRFFCPSCREERSYTLMAVWRFFHIYFIPLFRVRKAGQYVSCEGCGGQYDDVVLTCSRTELEQLEEEVGSWVCPACGHENHSRNCEKCGRWVCFNCGNSNPEKSAECHCCRTFRAG